MICEYSCCILWAVQRTARWHLNEGQGLDACAGNEPALPEALQQGRALLLPQHAPCVICQSCTTVSSDELRHAAVQQSLEGQQSAHAARSTKAGLPRHGHSGHRFSLSTLCLCGVYGLAVHAATRLCSGSVSVHREPSCTASLIKLLLLGSPSFALRACCMHLHNPWADSSEMHLRSERTRRSCCAVPFCDHHQLLCRLPTKGLKARRTVSLGGLLLRGTHSLALRGLRLGSLRQQGVVLRGQRLLASLEGEIVQHARHLQAASQVFE